MRSKGAIPGLVWVWAAFLLAGCGDDDAAPPGEPPEGCPLPAFEQGDEGHPEPLSASAGEARAGRVSGADLPSYPMEVWEDGDFVVANDRVAIVIEDVDDSDLYDPWGGRPVGIARVEDGQLVEPAEFGEFFILTGRFTVMTESVSVLQDGSDGGPAVVRATGPMVPLPFLENLVDGVFPQDFGGIPTAIDYVLEPNSQHVDIVVSYRSEEPEDITSPPLLHGFMYTYRMPTYRPGLGFNASESDLEYVAFIDEEATSYAYSVPGERMDAGLHVSGFESTFSDFITVPSCEELQRTHARLTVGGPGLDGLLQVMAQEQGEPQRAITGSVVDLADDPSGVRVHAVSSEGTYLTRTRTDDTGAFTLHVPEAEEVQLWAYRAGDPVVGPEVVPPSESSAQLHLEPTGQIHVTAVERGPDDAPGDPGTPLPVRVQVTLFDDEGDEALQDRFRVPAAFGEPPATWNRVHAAYPTDGEVSLRVPEGDYRVVVSRGYEYDIHDTAALDGPVEVTAGSTETVEAELQRVVDTAGYQCGDFHIHTRRSNDAADPPRDKVRAAVGDGVEILLRTEHEYVEPFQHVVEDLGLEHWAFGVTSVEMTSMEVWGHMNIFPLEPDPMGINGGTPLWQRWPTADDPAQEVHTLSPVEVFDEARARHEDPVVIINHPRGGQNYFSHVDYNPITGEVGANHDDWDESFTLVEVFNNAGWRQERNGTVADWLSFLTFGRRVFAVAASDSHGIERSPVGYPRTCLDVGTDDPTGLTPNEVRNVTAAGQSTISGGVFVEAWVNDAGPGEDAFDVGETPELHIVVQAPDWVPVHWVEVLMDGETVGDPIDLRELDPEPVPGTSIRFEDSAFPLPEPSPAGSFVMVAAYADEGEGLDPVHRFREPFGVTNPVFVYP